MAKKRIVLNNFIIPLLFLYRLVLLIRGAKLRYYMNDINICLLQTDIVWEDRTANHARLFELISNAKDADVYILPEMFSTGFSMNAAEHADPDGLETLKWMKMLAEKKNSVITGSAMIREGNHYYNSLFWVEPNGRVFRYDKRHLFTLAGEERVYSPGKERIIIEYKGWRIMPLICYDLRFPVWSRNNLSYDLLIYVANWPERRAQHWKKLLPARAIENLSYVAAVNRVGYDGNQIRHSGDSAAFSPLGEELTTIEPEKESLTYISLSASLIKDTRNKFSFLNDRDQFEIKTG
jgi:predicted amidohydrolase